MTRAFATPSPTGAKDIWKIAAWLQPREILLDVDLRDRAHACEFLGAEIARSHGLEAGPIARALWRREQAASTGLGHGFAIPHARVGGIERPITLFARAARAVDFQAPDGAPVSQLLAIIVPEQGARDDHLQMLALIAQLLSDGTFRERLARALQATEVAVTFRSGITQAADSLSGPLSGS